MTKDTKKRFFTTKRFFYFAYAFTSTRVPRGIAFSLS